MRAVLVVEPSATAQNAALATAVRNLIIWAVVFVAASFSNIAAQIIQLQGHILRGWVDFHRRCSSGPPSPVLAFSVPKAFAQGKPDYSASGRSLPIHNSRGRTISYCLTSPVSTPAASSPARTLAVSQRAKVMA